jgi:hypothetical protein
MKYSNYIGVAAAIALIIACFLPWVFIPSLKITLSGIDSKVSEQVNFGRQIIAHSFFCLLMIAFYLLPYVSVKRANVLIGAIHFAWAIKNFYVFTTCRTGECPEKRFGIYAIVVLAFVMLVITFLPKLEVQNEETLIT